MQVSGSILSILEKEEHKKEKIDRFNQTTCDYLHLDIIDGKFVEGKMIPTEELFHLIKDMEKPFDVHLMVKDIDSYIALWKDKKPTYITFHIEATDNPNSLIQTIKQLGMKVGIAISPDTPVSILKPYLHKIDLVLVMSVYPGMGGQSFIENSTKKIEQLKQLREENDYSYQIEVDGGINQNTITKVQNADIVVSGSYITNQDDYQEAINLLKGKNF